MLSVRDVKGSALLCSLFIVLLGVAAPHARAQDPPPQDPGVTQRVFQLGGAPSEICPIKPGQTPNVDVLKPTIDWEGDAAFGGLTAELHRARDRDARPCRPPASTRSGCAATTAPSCSSTTTS